MLAIVNVHTMNVTHTKSHETNGIVLTAYNSEFILYRGAFAHRDEAVWYVRCGHLVFAPPQRWAKAIRVHANAERIVWNKSVAHKVFVLERLGRDLMSVVLGCLTI